LPWDDGKRPDTLRYSTRSDDKPSEQ